MPLDPKKKYLIQIIPGNPAESGTVYPCTTVFAARKDMRPYDPVAKKAISDIPVYAPETDKVPIVLQGNTYNVDSGLHQVLTDLQEYVERIESENRVLVDEVKALREDKEEILKAWNTDVSSLNDQISNLKNDNMTPKELGVLKSNDTQPEAANPVSTQPETKPKPGRPKARSNK